MMSKWTICSEKTRAGNSLIGFLSKSLVFAKNEQMSDSLKKTNDLLIPSFWWATWAIRSHCSFFMSDLSDFLTVPHLSWAIWVNCSQSLIWFKQNERMSDEQMSKFPALEKSDWLIFGEWPEPFAHSHSFVMSDLSDSLTSLFKKEGMSESLRIFKLTKKFTNKLDCIHFF